MNRTRILCCCAAALALGLLLQPTASFAREQRTSSTEFILPAAEAKSAYSSDWMKRGDQSARLCLEDWVIPAPSSGSNEESEPSGENGLANEGGSGYNHLMAQNESARTVVFPVSAPEGTVISAGDFGVAVSGQGNNEELIVPSISLNGNDVTLSLALGSDAAALTEIRLLTVALSWHDLRAQAELRLVPEALQAEAAAPMAVFDAAPNAVCYIPAAELSDSVCLAAAAEGDWGLLVRYTGTGLTEDGRLDLAEGTSPVYSDVRMLMLRGAAESGMRMLSGEGKQIIPASALGRLFLSFAETGLPKTGTVCIEAYGVSALSAELDLPDENLDEFFFLRSGQATALQLKQSWLGTDLVVDLQRMDRSGVYQTIDWPEALQLDWTGNGCSLSLGSQTGLPAGTYRLCFSWSASGTLLYQASTVFFISLPAGA